MANGLISSGIVLIIIGAIIATFTYGPTMKIQKNFEYFDSACNQIEDELDAAYDMKVNNQEDMQRRDYEIDRLQNRLQECYYYRGEVAEDMFLGPGVLYSTSILGIFLGAFFVFLGIVYWGGYSIYRRYKAKRIQSLPIIPVQSENTRIVTPTPDLYFEDFGDQKIKENILNVIINDPNVSRTEISNLLYIDELDVELAIKDLIDDGRILDTGYGFELLKK